MIADCSEPNWDGYGAIPVSRRAIRHAREVLTRLGDVPEPELSADPDGEASMDWYGRNGRVFSLSVSPEARVSWASMVGPEIAEQEHGSLSLYDVATLTPKIQRVALRAIGEVR